MFQQGCQQLSTNDTPVKTPISLCHFKFRSIEPKQTHCKNVPATSATSYSVPLFTLVYIVLFHLLLPYNLDVPSYFTNRLRYCAAWPDRDRTLYTFFHNLFFSLLRKDYCCSSLYLCIG